MLNDLRDFLETLQWKKTWLGFLGFFAIFLTLFLARTVWNIGTSTSYFGDQFGVSKLFVITSNDTNGKRYKLRKAPNIRSEYYRTNRAEINDVYIYKGEADSDYIKIDPVFLKIYREGLGLNRASEDIIKSRKSFFHKDSLGGYEGYVINRAGKVFTPFEYKLTTSI